MNRIRALTLIVAFAAAALMAAGLAVPAYATPEDYRVVHLKHPSVSLAYPKNWIVFYSTPAELRAQRRQLAATRPTALDTYDRGVKEVRSQNEGGLRYVAARLDDSRRVFVEITRPRTPYTRRQLSLIKRELKAHGFRSIRVDGHRALRTDPTFKRKDGTPYAFATGVVTLSPDRIVRVQINQSGSKRDPVADEIVQRLHFAKG